MELSAEEQHRAVLLLVSSRHLNFVTDDKSRYLGKGVTKAVENINTIINDTITGMDASDIYAVDKAMIEADGTKG